MVQVGEVIQATHLFPETVVLSVGRPVIFDKNCPQLLGKTPLKPDANVSRVGVGVLRNEPALREPSPVASACEQGYSDFGIASLFDCAMPSANRYDIDKPNVDTVIYCVY